MSLSEAVGGLYQRILAAKGNKGIRHLSLFKKREKIVVEYHSLTHRAAFQLALWPSPPPPGTNAPSANALQHFMKFM